MSFFPYVCRRACLPATFKKILCPLFCHCSDFVYIHSTLIIVSNCFVIFIQLTVAFGHLKAKTTHSFSLKVCLYCKCLILVYRVYSYLPLLHGGSTEFVCDVDVFGPTCRCYFLYIGVHILYICNVLKYQHI